MAYEYDMKNLITKLSGVWVESEKKEILKELQEVYRKAKAFDELVNFYPQKDEIPSDEFFMMMGYIIEGYKDELKEVHSKAKAFDQIVEIYSDNDHYSDEYVMETIQEQIDLMECADDDI